MPTSFAGRAMHAGNINHFARSLALLDDCGSIMVGKRGVDRRRARSILIVSPHQIVPNRTAP